MEDQELFRTAQRILPTAYAPYSGFRVAAALLTKTGEVITGINVENSSYGASICAERTAFVKAVSEGHREFTAIAVACSGGVAYPCGICLQFMFEFTDDMKIIVGEDEKRLEVLHLAELLPKGFRL